MLVRFSWCAAQPHPTSPCLQYRYCAAGKLQYLFASWTLPVVRFFSREAGPFFSVCSLQEPKGDRAGQSLPYNFRKRCIKFLLQYTAGILELIGQMFWQLWWITIKTWFFYICTISGVWDKERAFPMCETSLCGQADACPRASPLPVAGSNLLPWPHTSNKAHVFASAVRDKAWYWPPT